MTFEYWIPQTTMLPVAILKETKCVERQKPIYYPYWHIPVVFSVKLPFLRPMQRAMEIVVDAYNGAPTMPPVVGKWRDEEYGSGPYTPSFSTAAAVNAILLAARHCLSAKCRIWGKVRSEIGAKKLIFKQLRVFKITFKNGTYASLALDTLSGKCGFVECYARQMQKGRTSAHYQEMIPLNRETIV